jgi:Ran GTPase-activating protein 1
MATTYKLLSLDGLALKVNTRGDVESWLSTVDPSVIEEIHLGGHTFSLEACLALAEFLQKTKVLKASSSTVIWKFLPYQRVSDCRLCGYVY